MSKPPENSIKNTLLNIESLMYLIVIVLVVLVFFIYQIFNTSDEILPWPKTEALTTDSTAIYATKLYTKSTETYWQAPELEAIKGSALESQILYGKDLIQNTPNDLYNLKNQF